MKELQDILIKEIKRVHARCSQGELDIDDLKKLESLTKSWRTYFGTEIDTQKNELTEMSVEDLVKMAKGEIGEKG